MDALLVAEPIQLMSTFHLLAFYAHVMSVLDKIHASVSLQMLAKQCANGQSSAIVLSTYERIPLIEMDS